MTIGTLIEVTLITDIKDAFDSVVLEEIGTWNDRPYSFVKNYVDNIYLALGRPMLTTEQERKFFAERFVSKYGNVATLVDIKLFADYIIEGEINVDYLCVKSLFGAWKQYWQMRNNEAYKIDQQKHRESYKESNVSELKKSAIIESIGKKIAEGLNIWEEYLATRPAGWQPIYVNGKNVEYAEYRKQALIARGFAENEI